MESQKQQLPETEANRYINPFTDFGFKKIFGEEPNKDLLIDFLNQLLLEQNITIKNLTYKKTEHLGTTDLDRKVVFDLYCESETEERFIVEMQKSKQSYFKDRSLYYATFPIQEQGIKSNTWNYQLKAVFAVAILDFAFSGKDKDKTIINHVQLIDRVTCEVFYDKLTFIFIQMTNFTKTIDELETRLDQWLYVLKNLPKFDRIPEKIKDKIFQKIFQIAEYQALSASERAAYHESLKYYRDLKNSLDTAEQEGFQKAEREYASLIAKAEQEKTEALQREALAEQEKQQTQIKLVLKMKKYGEPIDEIVKETGLSKDEIESL